MRHPNINKNMHTKQMFKGQKNLPKNVKLLAWLEYVILILRIWPTNPNYKIILYQFWLGPSYIHHSYQWQIQKETNNK